MEEYFEDFFENFDFCEESEYYFFVLIEEIEENEYMFSYKQYKEFDDGDEVVFLEEFFIEL